MGTTRDNAPELHPRHALTTFRSEMEDMTATRVTTEFGAQRVIMGIPNSEKLKRELEQVDFPIDTPKHIIQATLDFSLEHGVFPPSLITTRDESRMTEWCDMLATYRDRYGVRTAHKQLEAHRDVIERMATNGYDPISIASHLGCRTENITNFLKKNKIPLTTTRQTALPGIPDGAHSAKRKASSAPTDTAPRPRLKLIENDEPSKSKGAETYQSSLFEQAA